MAPQDLTTPWRLSLDVVFVVEEQRVPASRGVLAEWSPVMKAMFSDDVTTAKEPFEIPLPFAKFYHVQELMKVLHPPNKDVDGRNVKLLLPLAKEFKMDVLISKCERVLLLQPDTIANLVLADQYELRKLRQKCMNDIIHEVSVESLRKSESFNQLSDSSKAQIFKEKARNLDYYVYEVKQIIAGNFSKGHEDPNRYTPYNRVLYSCCVGEDHLTGDNYYRHYHGSEPQCRGCRWYMVDYIMDKTQKLP